MAFLFQFQHSFLHSVWSHDRLHALKDSSWFHHSPHCCRLFFVVTKQVNERGGFKEDREDQWKHNGGLHEEAAPKQHRKPERTPRYTRRSSSHPKPGLMKCSRMCLLMKLNLSHQPRPRRHICGQHSLVSTNYIKTFSTNPEVKGGPGRSFPVGWSRYKF